MFVLNNRHNGIAFELATCFKEIKIWGDDGMEFGEVLGLGGVEHGAHRIHDLLLLSAGTEVAGVQGHNGHDQLSCFHEVLWELKARSQARFSLICLAIAG